MKLKPYTVDEHGIKDWNPLFLLAMPLTFLFILIIIGGLLIGYYELGVKGATINSWGDAFWMAWMAASTVGFGDVYPVTFAGRDTVGAISGLGICTFGAIGTFVSLWLFSKFDTETQNRELRAQNAEIIRTNILSIEGNDRNEELNKEIVRTNQEAINGNNAILAELKS